MVYKLSRAVEADISAWSECLYDASLVPCTPLLWTYVPPHLDVALEKRRPARLQATTALMRDHAWHLPGATRLKVVDAAGAIVGGALYTEHPTNPFEDEQPPVAAWQPAGGARDFATRVLRCNSKWRETRMPKPHCYLRAMFVHPNHRRRGVATLMTEHLVRRADELRLPAWIESTPAAEVVYEAHGFRAVGEDVLVATPDDTAMADQEGWKSMASVGSRQHIIYMERLPNG